MSFGLKCQLGCLSCKFICNLLNAAINKSKASGRNGRMNFVVGPPSTGLGLQYMYACVCVCLYVYIASMAADGLARVTKSVGRSGGRQLLQWQWNCGAYLWAAGTH